VDLEQTADYIRCSGGLVLFFSSGHGARPSKTAASLTLRFPQVGDETAIFCLRRPSPLGP
jgi:hypothetical protein